MTPKNARTALRAALLSAALAVAPAAPAATQIARFTTESITLGAGGYVLNFDVQWSCDDAPQATTSAPGEIDLVDASGTIVGEVTGTVAGGAALVHVVGAGAVTGTNASVLRLGAGGSPANAFLHGTWQVSGLAAGPYTLRFWYFQEAVSGLAASEITTQASDAGGGGPVGGPPPPAPPSVSLTVPASATAFQPAAIGATASAGGNPLASVAIDMSLDNGTTWTALTADGHPSSPSDTENDSYAFPQAGTAIVRATATDTAGVQATSEKTLSIAKANQPPIVITPASATVAPGQAVAFAVSGGATGSYAWGGSASGSGASQSVTFASPGTFTVTAVDTGNANYNPSAMATATATVQVASYTLSVSATGGGTVSGGGTYAPGAQATAVATPDPGNTFSGWTGDATGAAPSVSVLMNANKSVLAHFTALLPQTISFVPPGAVSARSPAFTLSVTSSSGLPVSLVLDSGPVALAADTLTPTGTSGEVTLTATQAGNAQYLPALPLVITFNIGAAPPGVLFADDSAATKKTDWKTRTTSFTSGQGH